MTSKTREQEWKRDFLKEYKELCERFGMYIEADNGHGHEYHIKQFDNYWYEVQMDQLYKDANLSLEFIDWKKINEKREFLAKHP